MVLLLLLASPLLLIHDEPCVFGLTEVKGCFQTRLEAASLQGPAQDLPTASVSDTKSKQTDRWLEPIVRSTGVSQREECLESTQLCPLLPRRCFCLSNFKAAAFTFTGRASSENVLSGLVATLGIISTACLTNCWPTKISNSPHSTACVLMCSAFSWAEKHVELNYYSVWSLKLRALHGHVRVRLSSRIIRQNLRFVKLFARCCSSS